MRTVLIAVGLLGMAFLLVRLITEQQKAGEKEQWVKDTLRETHELLRQESPSLSGTPLQPDIQEGYTADEAVRLQNMILRAGINTVMDDVRFYEKVYNVKILNVREVQIFVDADAEEPPYNAESKLCRALRDEKKDTDAAFPAGTIHISVVSEKGDFTFSGLYCK